ncbi:MAG: hypothetical protein B6D46_03470 [Polyangiaceae bacterium UTPRO1]|nr:WS/DGAT domain-containing protein [Myxococcales bacterium]OQY68467.1 MAG: hypothetical protein B6D46_03470 [Polyangiaceae bacterium UTPRO1]
MPRVGWAVHPASATPLNGRLGPHRRVDWLSMSLADFKAVAKALSCTINDLVLATVTGAVRTFLISHHLHPEEIDFRVSAPVSVRRDAERGRLGNRVSSWILQLPIAEADPAHRLAAIRRVTQDLKATNQALGVETMMAIAEWTPTVLLPLGARAAGGPIDMILTNVPGPQFPLYLLGARLLELYPQVPLLESTGLGVAIFSYDGKLFWGFNADYELVPDLRDFVKAIAAAFRDLGALAPGTRRPANDDARGGAAEAQTAAATGR